MPEGLAGALGPYLVVLLVGFLPSEVWRWIGLVLARGMDENAPALAWVRATATALLAGLVARLLLLPTAALATVPADLRFGAVLGGLVAYAAAGRSVFAAVLVGEAILIAGALLLG